MTFDKNKFMEEQWAKLAAMYGVSVEEVKSKEFDEKIEREEQERIAKEMRLDKEERKYLNRSILIGGIVASIAAFLLWALISHRPIWSAIIAALVAFFIYVDVRYKTVESIKREDYYDDAEGYWNAVKKADFDLNMTMVGTSMFVLCFILFAKVI